MNRIIASALIATAALAGAAQADTLSHELGFYVQDADISGATAVERHSLQSVLNSDASHNEKVSAIRSVLK